MKLDKIKISLIVIISFILLKNAGEYLVPDSAAYWIRYCFPYLIWSIGIAAVVFLLGNVTRDKVALLGLSPPTKGEFFWAFVFTLPMLIGFATAFTFAADVSIQKLILGSVVVAFFEELFYRGFLFGCLYKLARWPFIPAALTSSILFGVSHWFQGANMSEALMASLFTGIGGLWFAWLMVKWQGKIWVAVTMHALMNAYWILWQVDDTAVGGNLANILRLTTMALSIVLTLRLTKRPE